MKTKTLLFAFSFLFIINIFAQPCLPEGIGFSSQEDIDNFQTNYPGCTEIEGDVLIAGIDIVSLYGLNVLTSIGGNLEIEACISLTTLNGLNNLHSVGGNLRIFSLTILTGIDALGNLSSVGGDLILSGNSALTDLTGLEGLTSITGELYINFNQSLQNLNGLDNVTSVGAGLYIALNDALTSLSGLGSLTTIGEYIGVVSNYVLVDFSGFTSLISITGNIEILCNNLLQNLSGLEHVGAESITDLFISQNLSLSTCEIESICDYLAAPNGTVTISYNAPGCNSIDEIIENCESTDIIENTINLDCFIYPNPAEREFYVINNNGLQITEVVIYNHLGQVVSKIFSINNPIDISNLMPGIYYVEIVGDGLKTNEKLIIR